MRWSYRGKTTTLPADRERRAVAVERIKRFLLNETATAEGTSTVVMIAAVGLMLVLGLGVYYGGLNGFFNTVASDAQTTASGFNWWSGS